jgi:hypothetical protein
MQDPGKFISGKRHFPTGKIEVPHFARETIAGAKNIGDNSPTAFANESFRMKPHRIPDAIQMRHAPSVQAPRSETRKGRSLYSYRFL